MEAMKLRAYQKNFKRFLPVIGVEFDSIGVIQSVRVDNNGRNGEYNVTPKTSFYCKDHAVWNLSVLNISRFTGLLDIDRTELYEHDIITTEICLMIVVWVQITASFGAISIKHYKELTDKNNIPTDNIYWFDNDIVDFGIYGNIYDNSEILTLE